MLARFKWPIILAIISIAVGVGALASLLHLFRDSGTSFIVPGEVSIDIKKAGKYTLWHEAKTMINGQILSFPDDLPSGTTIKVVKQPEGMPVTLRRGGSSHMEKSGIRRVSVGTLTFTIPGHYRITVDGLPEKRTFYLEQSKFARVFLTLMLACLGMLLFLTAIGSGIYILGQVVNARRNPAPAPSVPVP